MSVRLGLRIALGGLVGCLLVVCFAAALLVRDIALALAQLELATPEQRDALATQANNAALGLALTGTLALVVGVGILRAIRTHLIDRITTLDAAAHAIVQGDHARRIALLGNDELARVGRAIDYVLDARDRGDAEMRGHNREVRALLVALLRQWPKPAAVTGIDGEILVSTLSSDAEQVLRELSPRVRAAAKILLSRGFVSASELSTEVTSAGYVARVQALALGEQRIVGWLAVFETGAVAREQRDDDDASESSSRGRAPDEPAKDEPTKDEHAEP